MNAQTPRIETRIFQEESEEKPIQSGIKRIGFVKIGERRTKTYENGDKKDYPAPVDHFFLKDTKAEYVNRFKKAFGEVPKEISIFFLINDPENRVNCTQELVLWRGGYQYANGDGRTFNFYDREKGIYRRVTTLEEPGIKRRIEDEANIGNESKVRYKWRPEMILRFGLWFGKDQEEKRIKGHELGYFQLATGAVNSSHINILNTYNYIRDTLKGNIAMIPISLYVEMAKSKKMGGPKQYPVISMSTPIPFEGLTMLREMIDKGHLPPGILSYDRIREKFSTVHQIDAPEKKEEDPIIIDAKIVKEEREQKEFTKIEKAENHLRDKNIKNLKDLTDAAEKVAALGLGEEEKETALKIYREEQAKLIDRIKIDGLYCGKNCDYPQMGACTLNGSVQLIAENKKLKRIGYCQKVKG